MAYIYNKDKTFDDGQIGWEGSAARGPRNQDRGPSPEGRPDQVVPWVATDSMDLSGVG